MKFISPPACPVQKYARHAFLGLIALMWASSSAASSQLLGQVLDAESQEPLGFANVQLTGEGSQAGQATGADGRFRFTNLASGTYELSVFYVGYTTVRDTFLVAPDDSVFVTVALRSQAFTVKPVQVTASRPELEAPPIGSVTLDSEDIQELPGVIEKDPIRTLQLLPGVQSASDFSSGLYVRGGGPDQTLVLLDGVTLYNPSHFFGFFSTFNADAVSGVTLYKGAYPAQYTGRLGSVLDVRSRIPRRDALHGAGGLSTIAGRFLLEGPVGDGSFFVSGRRTYLDPLLSALRKNDSQIPSYYFYDLNGKLGLKLKNDDLIDVAGYMGQDDLRFDLTPSDFVNIRWGNKTLSATYKRFFGDSVLGTLLFSGSDYSSATDVFIFGTPVSIDNRLREGSVRGDLTIEAGEQHRIKTGVQSSVYDFLYQQAFNRDVTIDYRSQPFDVSVYGEDAWTSEDGITALTLGLRTRYFSDGDRLLFEPRATLDRRLNKKLLLKLGAGMYYQYLQLVTTEAFSAGDFYFPVDETAEPGQSIQGVAGLTWDVTPQYQLSGEVYYTRLSQLLTFDNTLPFELQDITTDAIFLTDGTGYATGLELFWQKRAGAVRGWVGYTLGWTRRTFAELNAGGAYPPKYDRRHDASVVGTYTSGPWTLGVNLVYGTGQAFTPAVGRYSLDDPSIGSDKEGGYVLPGEKNSARLLPYNRLDLSVSRDFKMFGLPAQWFFQVFNVYSRRNEWFIQYDADDPENLPSVVRQLPVIPSLGVNFEF